LTSHIDISIEKKTPEEIMKLFHHDDEGFDYDNSDLQKKQNEQLQLVKSNILAAQEKQKRDYDKRLANPQLFQEGALVLTKDHMQKKRKGGKLDARWLGPFTIVKVLPCGLYQITSSGESKSCPGSHLKPYKQLEEGNVFCHLS
jgi:hypothetical protein